MRNGTEKNGLGPSRLTEPEEAKGAYQDHLLLILCENLATSAMMGNNTRRKGFLKNRNQCSAGSTGVGEKRQEPRTRGGLVILDLQHHQRTDGQNCN
jgi:hypothetical protein